MTTEGTEPEDAKIIGRDDVSGVPEPVPPEEQVEPGADEEDAGGEEE
jgi:hypothetical protein